MNKLAKRIRHILLFALSFLLFFVFDTVQGQDSWEVHINSNKDKPELKSVNMDLYTGHPNYRYLVVVGILVKDCLQNGIPKESEVDILNKFSDSTALTVRRLTKKRFVGTYTYNCTSFDYIYVKDTMKLRAALTTQYKNNFKERRFRIEIIKDPRWKTYYDFLYPEEDDEIFFLNQDVLLQLAYKGDFLKQSRIIKHWIYFKTERRRSKFIDIVKNKDFKVDSLSYNKEFDRPYVIEISRKDLVNQKGILPLTRALKRLAIMLGGYYDSWETSVVK